MPVAKAAEAIKKYGIDSGQAQPPQRASRPAAASPGWRRCSARSTRVAAVAPTTAYERAATMGQPVDVQVPDIGDFTDVEVIEMLVKPGDTIEAEQA